MPVIKCVVEHIYIQCVVEHIYIQYPYCGHNNLIAPDHEYDEFIQYCTIEDGGCDKSFIVQYRAKVEFNVKVGKIDFI